MSIPFFIFFHFLCSFFLSTSFTVFYVSFYLHFTCFFVIKLFQSFPHSLLASMPILVELSDSLSLMLICPVIRFVRCMCLRYESLFYVILPSIRWSRSFLPRHCSHKKIKKIALSCDALKNWCRWWDLNPYGFLRTILSFTNHSEVSGTYWCWMVLKNRRKPHKFKSFQPSATNKPYR